MKKLVFALAVSLFLFSCSNSRPKRELKMDQEKENKILRLDNELKNILLKNKKSSSEEFTDDFYSGEIPDNYDDYEDYKKDFIKAVVIQAQLDSLNKK